MEIPLIHKKHQEMIQKNLNKAAKEIGLKLTQPIEGLKSNNMSDILELRGRLDCEVILNDLVIDDLLNDELSKLLSRYQLATNVIFTMMENVKPNESIGGFKSTERKERYDIIREINQLLYSKYEEKIKIEFSCLNLSMDYNEANGFMDLKEMQNIILLLNQFILN
jgi:hypothetical protein